MQIERDRDMTFIATIDHISCGMLLEHDKGAVFSQVHEGHPERDDDEPCDELDVRAAQLRLLADAPRALGLRHAVAGVPVRADAGLYLVLVR